MAEADWKDLSAPALTTTDIPRGVSNAFTLAHPAACGNFCFCFKSANSTGGFGGKTVDATVIPNFGPFPGANKGGSIRGIMKRYTSGVGYAPMLALINAENPITGTGYIVGLSQASSYAIALKKGTPATGLLPTEDDILRIGSTGYTAVGDSADVWHHVRLDVIVNPHGEVVLNVYENDIQTNGVAAPIWTPIDGMDTYIDDSIGVLTGSLPVTTGFYPIFGHYTSNQAGAVSMFDHIEVFRQTAP